MSISHFFGVSAGILFILSLVGLVKPKLVLFFLPSEKRTRGKTLLIFGLAFFVCWGLGMATQTPEEKAVFQQRAEERAEQERIAKEKKEQAEKEQLVREAARAQYESQPAIAAQSFLRTLQNLPKDKNAPMQQALAELNGVIQGNLARMNKDAFVLAYLACHDIANAYNNLSVPYGLPKELAENLDNARMTFALAFLDFRDIMAEMQNWADKQPKYTIQAVTKMMAGANARKTKADAFMREAEKLAAKLPPAKTLEEILAGNK